MNTFVDFSKQPQSPAELAVNLDYLVSNGLSETSALIMTDLNYQIQKRAEATAKAEYYERSFMDLVKKMEQKEEEIVFLNDQVCLRENILSLYPLYLSRKNDEIASLTALLREQGVRVKSPVAAHAPISHGLFSPE